MNDFYMETWNCVRFERLCNAIGGKRIDSQCDLSYTTFAFDGMNIRCGNNMIEISIPFIVTNLPNYSVQSSSDAKLSLLEKVNRENYRAVHYHIYVDWEHCRIVIFGPLRGNKECKTLSDYADNFFSSLYNAIGFIRRCVASLINMQKCDRAKYLVAENRYCFFVNVIRWWKWLLGECLTLSANEKKMQVVRRKQVGRRLDVGKKNSPQYYRYINKDVKSMFLFITMSEDCDGEKYFELSLHIEIEAGDDHQALSDEFRFWNAELMKLKEEIASPDCEQQLIHNLWKRIKNIF